MFLISNKKNIYIHKEFKNIFYTTYCITIFVSQGKEFGKDYTIHDWEKLDKYLKYIALTGAIDKKTF